MVSQREIWDTEIDVNNQADGHVWTVLYLEMPNYKNIPTLQCNLESHRFKDCNGGAWI